MENKIQTNLPSDISLHPRVKGEGSRSLLWGESLCQSINYPCKNLKDTFSPPSELNRRSFTACNRFVYQSREEENCLETSGHEIHSQDAVFYRSLRGWEWVHLHTRFLSCWQQTPPEITWLSNISCYWIRALGYIKTTLWLSGLLQNVAFNFSSLGVF